MEFFSRGGGGRPVLPPSPEREYVILLACLELLTEMDLSKEMRQHMVAIAEARIAALEGMLEGGLIPDRSWR